MPTQLNTDGAFSRPDKHGREPVESEAEKELAWIKLYCCGITKQSRSCHWGQLSKATWSVPP